MRILFTLLFVVFGLSNQLFAQSDVNFFLKIANYATSKAESGATVKLYEGSTLVNTLTSSSTGEVALKLKPGKKYKVEITKAGKVMRFFNIDATKVNDELLQGSSKLEGSAKVSIFDNIPGADFSYVTANPFTEFYFDGITPEFQYDGIIADRMAKKIEKIMKDAEALGKQGDANYNSIIKQADALYTAKKYEEALAQYEAAVKVPGKAMEKHPNDRIIEISGILKAKKAADLVGAQLDNEYKALITSADALFQQKKYTEAMARYQEAWQKKQEQYPKDQIVECEYAIEAEKKAAANKEKFNELMKSAEMFYNQKSWMAARDAYKEALKLVKGDPTATAKLADVEAKILGQKADQEKKQKYNDAVAAADALMTQEKWAEAKAKYTEALTFESAATYPKDKIKEADVKLAELAKVAALKEQLTKLLTEASTAFNAKQYVQAKAKYDEVLKLDNTHADAKAKLIEIDKILADEKTNADKIAKAKQLALEGDALDKALNFVDAKAKYTESVNLIADATVQAKINALNLKIEAESKKAENKAKFDQAIAAGDAAFNAGNLEEAKKKYLEAQVLDPIAELPKQKLAAVDKKMAELSAEKDKVQKYSEAYTAGLTALSAKDYKLARDKFKAAIAIDGTKQEAKDKLAEAERFIAEIEKANATKEKYEQTIKAASDLQNLSKLPEAKKKYEEAKAIDPTQTLPDVKIKEIEDILSKAENDKKITQLLSEGNTAFNAKDYSSAKAKYQEVLKIDKMNATASEKLLQISKIESDNASAAEKKTLFEKLKNEGIDFQSKNKYREAKQKYLEARAIQDDSEITKAIEWCTKKINEEENEADKLANYNKAMDVARALEASKKYDEAIAAYQNALTIKSDAVEPKNRIEAIKALKEENVEKLKVEQEYQASLKKGDDLVLEKKYTEAIQAYNYALTLKPYEKLPVEKAEAARKMAESETNDADQAYQKILDVGLKSMAEKNYKKAKDLFNRALSFRPSDPLPKQKLAEIVQLEKDELLNQELSLAYQKKMDEAEALVKADKLSESLAIFQAAKKIKSNETLPDKRIADVQNLMASRTAGAAEIQRQYSEAMQRGNEAATAKNYNDAIRHYETALSFVKNDKAASDRIAEMRQLLDNIAKENASTAEINALLADADAKFNASKWSDAKAKYDEILKKFPSNQYAHNQSVACEAKMKDEREADVEKVYRKIIEAADKKFVDANYEKAIELYKRALTQRPDDLYPKQRLVEIDAILHPQVAKVERVDNSKGQELELKDLGIETDNSILDGQARLQQASNTKKGRVSKKMTEKFNEVENRSSDRGFKQHEGTQVADSLFTQVRIDNSARDRASIEKAQENVSAVKVKSQELEVSKIEKGALQELNTANQKNQLDAATLSVEQKNSLLNTASVENNEVVKKSNENLGVVTTEKSNQAYVKSAVNDSSFVIVKKGIENNDLDNYQDKLVAEHKVKEASVRQEDVRRVHAAQQVETAADTKRVIENSNQVITTKESENYKLSQINEEKVYKTNQAIAEQQSTMAERHVDLTHAVDAQNSKAKVQLAEMNDARTTAAVENTVKIEEKRDSKTEVDRKAFNDQYVKGIDNKAVLTQREIEIEQKKTLPSALAAEENVKKFNQVQQTATDKTAEQSRYNAEKIVSNNQKIVETRKDISDNASVSAKNVDNSELIKNAKEELGTEARIQSSKSEDKTQATKKMIDDTEKNKTEKVQVGTYEVDLSKYPEGVSQEQFDIPGPDGVLSAIATRRIVVREGKADVYVRTQTVDIITFSKNGAPTTEYVWQKETNDPKLKRNY
jgi:tetratricopeptide (TPR) repeat protein